MRPGADDFDGIAQRLREIKGGDPTPLAPAGAEIFSGRNADQDYAWARISSLEQMVVKEDPCFGVITDSVRHLLVRQARGTPEGAVRAALRLWDAPPPGDTGRRNKSGTILPIRVGLDGEVLSP